VVIIAGIVIALINIIQRGDAAYSVVILWVYLGIIIKRYPAYDHNLYGRIRDAFDIDRFIVFQKKASVKRFSLIKIFIYQIFI